MLPLRSPLLTLNDQRRAHWTTVRKAKSDVELLISVAVNKAKLKPIEGPVVVWLVWYAPDRRARDCDGLAPMLKACLDALVHKGILPDDNSEIVHQACLGPIVVARDNPRFELQIRGLEG
ncbi:RusA family crossover junction endodeoxyribonuclease [Mycobacterium intracellulare]|uniref:RusA family crossover junction endodeoxyribonuclease n=1 Tax=Mycobacterium intracellulare TaxID=1767 RepID=UPI00398A6AB3